MTSYFLRVAATNFANFIGDTEHLPAIRGGSLILERGIALAAEAIDEVISPPGQKAPPSQASAPSTRTSGTKSTNGKSSYQVVSQGGSVGLFAIEDCTDEQAGEILEAVRAKLANPPEEVQALRHATFVADIIVGAKHRGKPFTKSIERATAANRWQQMQAPSVAIPSPIASGAEACRRNHLRPAGEGSMLAGDRLCASVHERREYGLGIKQAFYKNVLGFDYKPGYSATLEDLSHDPSRGSLHGKMAVIYLDGNRFGEIQREQVLSIDSQKEFDQALAQTRKTAFEPFLDRANLLPGMLELDSRRLRTEVLLWGGDDMILVVPGWAGLWTLATIFSTHKKWKYRKTRLTFGCGMVLCHHNAPIHRIRQLADQLTACAKSQFAKDESAQKAEPAKKGRSGKKDDSDKPRNLVAYEVLESFDDVGDDLDRYRAERTPKDIETKDLALDPTTLGDAIAAYGAIRDQLPVRQVRAAAQAARCGDLKAVQRAATQARRSLSNEAKEHLADLLRSLGAMASPPSRPGSQSTGQQDPTEAVERLGWFHLGQLGDYLLPLKEERDD